MPPRIEPIARPPLSAMLKSGTQDLHDRAESQPFQRDVAAGAISREQYAAFLVQVLHVHATLDPILRSIPAEHPVFRELAVGQRLRYDPIRRDLDDLGVRHERFSVYAATRRFTAHLTEIAPADPAPLVGVLYVYEGATNGNKIIVKSVQRALGLPPGHACRYLDPYGPEQRRRWMAFKTQLDLLPLAEPQIAPVIAAAQRTFEFFAEVGAELSGAASPG
jgi:heme oxygenase